MNNSTSHRAPDRDAECAAMRSALEEIAEVPTQHKDIVRLAPGLVLAYERIAEKALASTAGTELLDRLRKQSVEILSLIGQLAAVTAERDEAKAEIGKAMAVFHEGADDDRWEPGTTAVDSLIACLAAAESARDALAKAIQDAPHADDCAAVGLGHVFPCDCWKSIVSCAKISRS